MTHLATVLRFLSIFSIVLSAKATELNDSQFGFRLNVPDFFNRLEVDSSEPDTIYKFIDRPAASDTPAQVIQIQRLRGVISATSRMKQSDLPIVDGVATTLQEFTWKGLGLDVVRQEVKLPGDRKFMIFTIQYPLSGEAVQLQVGGPSEEEAKIYDLFTKTAGGFENTRPLHAAASPNIRKLSTEERVGKIVRGVMGLAVIVIIVVSLFRVVKRKSSKQTG